MATRFIGFAAATAVVAAVIIVGLSLSDGGPFIGGDPSVSPSAPPSVAPSEAPASVEGSAEAFLREGPFVWVVPATASGPRTDLPMITVTIPASGWTCDAGGYQACVLYQGGGLDTLGAPDGRLPESAFLATVTTAGIHVYEDACQVEYDLPDPPAATAAEIAAALAAQPSRDASDPVDVMVGGYPGREVTLRVPDDLGYTDEGFTDCFHGYASYTLGDHDAPGTLPTRWHQGPGQIDTFWIVDVDGAIVIIDAMYRADTSAERIEEMRVIAESATFKFP
jgi:hypothetical protein